jgi:hypothetical protein
MSDFLKHGGPTRLQMSVIARLDRAIQQPAELLSKYYQSRWLLDAPLEAGHDRLSIHSFPAVSLTGDLAATLAGL